ncbi:MAG: hypothetical protein JF886_14230 [Candidatus Dormibacteraeota bacterium]|uniref:Uncharacterized protein n=1 Tax=Candidatus Aeolococcus gillhamiae TaxID=3127015 RepID=A0A934N4V6_9BACT|nr:hypothetical protein [Candidatus Dormibacteraeota bacterium]
MDRRTPALTPRPSTDRPRPSAGGGTAADPVERHLSALRVVPDITVPSATGGPAYRSVDHAAIAAVLHTRRSHVFATTVDQYQERETR